jgi:hypothetical protein
LLVPLSPILWILVGCTAGSGSAPSPTSQSGSPPAVNTAALVTLCISETNRDRASFSKPSLIENAALDAYASAGAQSDGQTHIPHGHYIGTAGGGVAMAENEDFMTDVNPSGMEQFVKNAIAQFWAEGPGGGHYQNMIANWTIMGCGIDVTNQTLTLVQDFR